MIATTELIKIIKKFNRWKLALRYYPTYHCKNKVCAAVLTDLLTAFDCLKHDLLIGKVHAFGFN